MIVGGYGGMDIGFGVEVVCVVFKDYVFECFYIGRDVDVIFFGM